MIKGSYLDHRLPQQESLYPIGLKSKIIKNWNPLHWVPLHMIGLIGLTKNPSKVSFFGQCSKMQLIPLQNIIIKTCFIQFLWFFRLKCWFKGQIISRIHLSLPNAYKLMCWFEWLKGQGFSLFSLCLLILELWVYTHALV